MVWRGWGFIAPLFLIIAVAVATLIDHLTGGRLLWLTSLIYGLNLLAAGIVVGFAAHALEARPGRVRAKKRGRRGMRVGNNAGAFLLIPTRYWSILSGLIGLTLGLGLFTHWTFQGLPFIR